MVAMMWCRRSHVAVGLVVLSLCLLLSVAQAILGGTVDKVPLVWQDIDCTIGDKVILQSVSGEADPGRLLALIGPSGSGKTTLLNSLSGQVPRTKKMSLSGRVYAGGERKGDKYKQAFVRQADVFYSQLTVRETLEMAARLRLPRTMSVKAKREYVDGLMKRLGLAKCADTVVGDDTTRGISGGEKKRLNLACELFGSPALLFADEPTTGLDSFQAERVMETLKELAVEGGHTVIASIHQPRGSIYDLFDDLMVLSNGRVMYAGPADKAADYFTDVMAKVGKTGDRAVKALHHSAHLNPAEFIIDLVSPDSTSPANEKESRERIARLGDAFAERSKGMKFPLVSSLTSSSSSGRGGGSDEGLTIIAKETADEGKQLVKEKKKKERRAGLVEQFRLLFVRSWRQVIRSKYAIIAKVGANVGSGIIFGCIYWKLGLGQTQIMDRLGLMQVAAVNTAMSSVIKTLNTFPTERSIVQYERQAGTYSVAPYLVSKLVAELPLAALIPNLFGLVMYRMTGLNPGKNKFATFSAIITLEAFTASALGMLVGAFTPNEDSALAIGPSLMTVAIIFSGFYINPENIPAAFRWLKTTSLIKWAFEGLSVNELQGQEFTAGDQKFRGPMIKTGEQMLERIGFGNSDVKGAITGLGRILASCYALTYFFLVKDVPKFQKMEWVDDTTSPQA